MNATTVLWLARLVHLHRGTYHSTPLYIKVLLTARSKFSSDDEGADGNGAVAGKRQAKKYIRKALSFGVGSGYLTPTDARGNVLRVCPTLVSSRTSDVESRRKRRIARRGDTRLMTIDDRKAMRRGAPKSKTSRRDVRAEDATTSDRRRYRRHPTESPARSLSAKNDGPRKSPAQSRLREKNKSRSSGARRNRWVDSPPAIETAISLTTRGLPISVMLISRE